MFKKLSNLGEQRVYEELKPAAERYGAEVYRTVNLISSDQCARKLARSARVRTWAKAPWRISR